MVFLVQMKLIHKKNIYNITKWDFDAADLKIGWKDKDLYYLVTDKILFPTQTTWDMNFIFYMQNRGNTGWNVKYEIVNTPSYYNTSKSLQISIELDEDIFYTRIINKHIFIEEYDFLYTILSSETNKKINPNNITDEWKKEWVNTNDLTIQPKNFNIKLFEYQLKSLNWALNIEKSNYMSKFYANFKTRFE